MSLAKVDPARRKEIARLGGMSGSRKNVKNKSTLEMQVLMEENDYCPAKALMESRNRRAEDAMKYVKKAKEVKTPEVKIAYLNLAEKQLTEMEKIDRDLMPYRYTKLASIEFKPNGDSDDPLLQLQQAILEAGAIAGHLTQNRDDKKSKGSKSSASTDK